MSANELSRPLLSFAAPYGEEEVDESSTATDLETMEGHDHNEPCCDVHHCSWFDNSITWFLLPVLLFLQFSADSKDVSAASSAFLPEEISMSSWNIVYSISLYLASAILFRRCIKDIIPCCHEEASTFEVFKAVFLLLWPEIAMDFVLLLLLCNQAGPAYICMMVFSMLQSIAVMGVSCKQLFFPLTHSTE